MQYDGLAWVTALLAVLAALVATRILFNSHWFFGWLRGTCGLAFLLLAGLVGLIAYDLYSYEPLPQDKPLVTLSFKANGPRYQVSLVEDGHERSVTVEGDLWQLDVRLQPGYRLEQLSGRFLAIEQQAQAQHGPVKLAKSPYGIDIWRWLRLGQHDLFMFEPQAQRITYLPIADAAVYSVSLTSTGLLALPMNQAAEQALQDWQ